MKKGWTILIKSAGLMAIAMLSGYAFLIVRGKQEMGGASPDRRVLGSTIDVSQRAMEQYATGVLVTPTATWLVGRREGGIEEFPFAAGLHDLSDLLPRASTPGLDLPFLGFGSRPTVSFISRLSSRGTFEPIAVVPGVARPIAAPDGKRLFLLTDLEAAEESKTEGPRQFAIFQSDDQGRTWQWRKEGLFPAIDFIAWGMNLHFHDSRSVWAWKEGIGEPKEGSGEPVAPRIQFSPDGGDHCEDVRLDRFKPVVLDELRGRVPPDAYWGDGNGRYGDVKTFLTQLDQETAAVWISQRFAYNLGGGPYYTDSLGFTTRLLLKRKDNAWRVEDAQRQDGLTISTLQGNGAGRVVAVVNTADGSRAGMALLDKQRLDWDVQGPLPGAFGILTSGTGMRELFLGKDVVVANVMSDHEVPRWLYPWGSTAATISADAVFYSRDWGKTWRRLAIAGYLGVLGMDAAENRVVFARGHWYDSQDPDVYSCGLK